MLARRPASLYSGIPTHPNVPYSVLLCLPYHQPALLILLLLALLSYKHRSIVWRIVWRPPQRRNRRNLSEWNRSDVVKVRRSCREALVDGQETADFIKVNEDLWLVGLRKARSHWSPGAGVCIKWKRKTCRPWANAEESGVSAGRNTGLDSFAEKCHVIFFLRSHQGE